MIELNTDLHIETPHGIQSLYFDMPDNQDILTREYDSFLLVIDERVANLKAATRAVSHLKLPNNRTYTKQISINNKTKNSKLLLKILDAMEDSSLSRNSLIISVGGGATADLVGTAAAIYMRGIDYAIIPTSYISAADGIISKVAVNHRDTKNMLGAFQSPRWSLITPELVDSLSHIQAVQGLVEVWKHSLIEQDKNIEEIISIILSSKEASREQLVYLARWSMSVKARYVMQDWDDTRSIHKALSLGHTIANYLEMNDELHHSEAVLYGIVYEAIIAKNRSILSNNEFENILSTAALFNHSFQAFSTVADLLSANNLPEMLARDKISSFNVIRFVLPTQDGYVVTEVTNEEVQAAAKEFTKLAIT